jgi:predicted TIM-barrel fold metal-dependent hydrolase
MNVCEIEAIDVHAHYGPYRREGDNWTLINQFMSGDAELVVERARMANTYLTIVSPHRALLPRFKGDPVGGNEDAERVVTEYPQLRQWVVVHPLVPETYTQAERILQQPTCAGIKIHPEEHGYPIKDHGRAIFQFAAEHRAIMLTHSGHENSQPEEFVPFANDFPEVQLILAHIGCTIDIDPGHQVRAVQQSKHGNMFADTSSAQSVIPGLIEWAVKEIGSERILYGTDTPVYFAPMQRTRINLADIDDADKKRILRDNAVKLFKCTL